MATKKSPVKKKTKAKTQQTPSQNAAQDAEQQEFVMWLQQRYGLQDEQQLQQKAEELGEEGIKQEYMAFQQEKAQQQAQAFRHGGMLDRLIKLQTLKKGGKKEMPVKKLKMKGISTGTAEIETIPTKNINIDPKPIIKKKK